MATIPQVSAAMQTVLTTVAETAARTTGCVQRQVKLTGAGLVQTLVFGWWQHPAATLHQLTQMAATLGVGLSPQALHQRFTPALAACLAQVLEASINTLIGVEPVALALFARFTAVVVQDSTTLTLPPALATLWPGCGAEVAAVKLQVRWDLTSGQLDGPYLEPGRCHDRASVVQTAPLPPGALRLADLGYFSLDVLADLAQQGSYFVSRLHVQTVVAWPGGERLDVTAWLRGQAAPLVDQPVHLGATHHLPVRLIAAQVPPEVAAERRRRLHAEAWRRGQMVSHTRLAWADWTLLVTTAPVTLLATAEVLVLARVRWQIELLFKLWKDQGHLDTWRSTLPWRILGEVYAKLVALVAQHWLLLVSCWRYPDRSLVQASQTIRSYGILLASAFAGVLSLETAISQLARCLATGCRIRRRRAPATFQLLLALEEGFA